ncbi:hypothetical protein DXK93_05085 [Achromobacter sp. K91]|uniref:hypothetical protein n=1 Tax=Achromobacter sp. K91 TaxID=2292262 RepID=UPI000E6728E6|nr:hypothetical protein DXK93_05085 [Achromobacter sp. K91]
MKFSLLMAFVCVTGTLAVISMELEWLARSELRVEPAPLAAQHASTLVLSKAAITKSAGGRPHEHGQRADAEIAQRSQQV